MLDNKMLLSRDEFRNAVFTRDKHKCVVCQESAQDAHHIIERRLFSDGGYYLNNGASVCGKCHLLCESTDISVEQIRMHCGISGRNIILPDQFYDDDKIDKWGNYILPNGSRLRGPLFYDESVQKILGPKLSLFIDYVKHPRTPHLPWSLGRSSDDIATNIDHFENREVVVTEKMDGENTTFYNDYMHARSIDSGSHISRHRAKAEWAAKCGEIPTGYRFVLENMYAQHSIKYTNLRSYLYGLFVWNDKNNCLSWDETVEWLQLLDFSIPKVLYRGMWSTHRMKYLANSIPTSTCEGYVVRICDEFPYSMFSKSVAKFVRENHVQTKHWSNQTIIPNKLKQND